MLIGIFKYNVLLECFGHLYKPEAMFCHSFLIADKINLKLPSYDCSVGLYSSFQHSLYILINTFFFNKESVLPNAYENVIQSYSIHCAKTKLVVLFNYNC